MSPTLIRKRRPVTSEWSVNPQALPYKVSRRPPFPLMEKTKLSTSINHALNVTKPILHYLVDKGKKLFGLEELIDIIGFESSTKRDRFIRKHLKKWQIYSKEINGKSIALIEEESALTIVRSKFSEFQHKFPKELFARKIQALSDLLNLVEFEFKLETDIKTTAKLHFKVGNKIAEPTTFQLNTPERPIFLNGFKTKSGTLWFDAIEAAKNFDLQGTPTEIANKIIQWHTEGKVKYSTELCIPGEKGKKLAIHLGGVKLIREKILKEREKESFSNHHPLSFETIEDPQNEELSALPKNETQNNTSIDSLIQDSSPRISPDVGQHLENLDVSKKTNTLPVNIRKPTYVGRQKYSDTEIVKYAAFNKKYLKLSIAIIRIKEEKWYNFSEICRCFNCLKNKENILNNWIPETFIKKGKDLGIKAKSLYISSEYIESLSNRLTGNTQDEDFLNELIELHKSKSSRTSSGASPIKSSFFENSSDYEEISFLGRKFLVRRAFDIRNKPWYCTHDLFRLSKTLEPLYNGIYVYKFVSPENIRNFPQKFDHGEKNAIHVNKAGLRQLEQKFFERNPNKAAEGFLPTEVLEIPKTQSRTLSPTNLNSEIVRASSRIELQEQLDLLSNPNDKVPMEVVPKVLEVNEAKVATEENNPVKTSSSFDEFSASEPLENTSEEQETNSTRKGREQKAIGPFSFEEKVSETVIPNSMENYKEAEKTVIQIEGIEKPIRMPRNPETIPAVRTSPKETSMPITEDSEHEKEKTIDWETEPQTSSPQQEEDNNEKKPPLPTEKKISLIFTEDGNEEEIVNFCEVSSVPADPITNEDLLKHASYLNVTEAFFSLQDVADLFNDDVQILSTYLKDIHWMDKEGKPGSDVEGTDYLVQIESSQPNYGGTFFTLAGVKAFRKKLEPYGNRFQRIKE